MFISRCSSIVKSLWKNVTKKWVSGMNFPLQFSMKTPTTGNRIQFQPVFLSHKRNFAVHKRYIHSGNNAGFEPNIASLFTEEHMQMRAYLKKLIDTDINPNVDRWEAERNLPLHHIAKLLGNAGFLGVSKPIAYGGLGLDHTYQIAVAEQLGHITCGSIPMAMAVLIDYATPALTKYGSEDLKQRYLAPVIAGDHICSIAVSEPDAGSDVSALKTTAVKDGDDYVINGTKMWITNAFHADWICLLCNTGEGSAHKNKSLIIVPTNTPGFQLTKRLDKMGMHSSDTAQIFFEDVRVPRSNLIGEENMGFIYQMEQFQMERLFRVATVPLLLERAIHETIEYTRNRKVFGRPLLYNQVIHFRLAELQTEVEALRALIYRATGKFVAGEDVTMFVSMAKLKAGRLAREVTDFCLQYWGGMGYMNDVIISRLYRDARLLSIGGGADEIMLKIISKYMGSHPKT